MNKIIYLTIAFVFINNLADAQDAHFSQTRLSNAYLNPGLTGLFNKQADLRASVMYRKQWSFSPSYRDFMVGLDKSKGKMRVGGLLWGQDAGENSLKTIGGKVSVGIHQALGGEGNSLNLGFGLGFVQQKFNQQKLIFDNQYDGNGGTSPDYSSEEIFARTARTVPDFSAGLVLQKRALSDKMDIEAGFSFANLTRPAASFFTDDVETRQWKTAIHGTVKYEVANNIRLEPFFWYIKQGKAKNQTFGADVSFKSAKNTWSFGLGSRLKDAYIVRMGIDFKNQYIGLSADLNNSDLKSVSQGRGGWELAWVGYITTPKREKKPREIKETKPVELPDTAKKTQVMDSDGDGIVDSKDLCPELAGLIKYYGCNDTDGDDVPDNKDQCPNLPGKINRAGCPEVDGDSDGDGIIDAKDNCPFISGAMEFRGCPDTDEDGVPDLSDNCPFLKGLIINKGCPTEGSNAPVGIAEALVEFETNQAIIRPEYHAVLTEFAIRMSKKPKQQILISGHTDSEGDAAHNNTLSLKRAQAVQNYLMILGLDMSNSSLMHYGENMPKRENDNGEGKARNRRVEIRVTDF
jgi:type IX secretion system PorP/SprF family membrane protein